MADGRIINTGEAKKAVEGLLGSERRRYTDPERQLFISAWLTIVKTEGINPTVVGFLYKGFDIAGAEPLYCYALSAEGEGTYKKFFLSRGAFDDKAGTLKIALSLLSYELGKPTTQDSLDFVARRLCDAAMSLGKRAQASIKSNVTALLIRPLAKSGISGEAHIESTKASSLDNYLRPGLEAAISRKGAKADVIRAASELIDWLGKQKVEMADEQPEAPASVVAETKGAAPNPPEDNAPNSPAEKPAQSPASQEPAPTVVTADNKSSARTASRSSRSDKPEEPTKSGNPPKPARKSSKKPTKGKEGNEGGDLDMATVIAFLSKLQKDHDELEGQLGSVRSEKIEMSGKIIELEQRLRAAQREIDSLKDHRSTLSGNYSALQQQCEALKAENQSLRSELDDANEMIAMMDEGSSHEADAALASLGRELGYDYRKYLAAAAQPMTAELGNIVLGQLRTVFGILERHGIDLQ